MASLIGEWGATPAAAGGALAANTRELAARTELVARELLGRSSSLRHAASRLLLEEGAGAAVGVDEGALEETAGAAIAPDLSPASLGELLAASRALRATAEATGLGGKPPEPPLRLADGADEQLGTCESHDDDEPPSQLSTTRIDMATLAAAQLGRTRAALALADSLLA